MGGGVGWGGLHCRLPGMATDAMSVFSTFAHDGFLGEVAEFCAGHGWELVRSGIETRSREFQEITRFDFTVTARSVRGTPDGWVHHAGGNLPSFMVEAKGPTMASVHHNVQVEAMPLAVSMLAGWDCFYLLKGQNPNGPYAKAFHVSQANDLVGGVTIPKHVRRNGQEWTRDTNPDDEGRPLAPDTIDHYRPTLERAFPQPSGQHWPRVSVMDFAAAGSGDPWVQIPDTRLRELADWQDVLRDRMEGNP